MPHEPHLAERMRQALKTRAGIAERRMFGGYCWMLHGNMLCGVEVGRFMFRVPAEPCSQMAACASSLTADKEASL